MANPHDGELRIDSESDVVMARRRIREATKLLGFGITDVTRIVTAASELTRNIYQHAGSGRVQWQRLRRDDRIGIELVFEDDGPGIGDVGQVMEEGYTSGGGLGMGLPGSKRLMDDMEISSEPGRGTTITVRKWRRA